jgi:hypothetical protein
MPEKTRTSPIEKSRGGTSRKVWFLYTKGDLAYHGGVLDTELGDFIVPTHFYESPHDLEQDHQNSELQILNFTFFSPP